MKNKSILESKEIEEIWPSIPEKFRARWEEVYKTFHSRKKSYKQARRHINGLRKHATIDEKFLVTYKDAKEKLIELKRAFDAQRKRLNKLSLGIFANVPVEQYKKEEKKNFEPFTVVLTADQLTSLAQAIKKCLENWPKNVNRVSLQFDSNVSYSTHAVSESENADDSKKTFVTSKKGN